jgi:hypothetical protein
MTNKALIEAIRSRADNLATRNDMTAHAETHVYPRLSEEVVRSAELRLGFALPAVLRSIYLEVGNGGFGPGYGIFGLQGGHRDEGSDVISLYELWNQVDDEDLEWRWPAYYVPVCHWGCAIYSCVDAYTHDGAMIIFDPNQREPGEAMSRAFRPDQPTIGDWLAMWVRGVRLWDEMCKGGPLGAVGDY